MAPLETLERVKLPLRSVTVPFLVPFTTTVAPIIISPFASLTTPRQVCCCWTICVEMPAYANVLAEEAANVNKLLVPTYPIQKADEAGTDYDARLQKDYYEVSSIAGIFKSFGDAPGGMKEELQEVQWSLGGEYTYNDKFTVRAGYHHESENKGNMKYFTVGAGFKMNVMSIDAGYVIATAKSNPLDQTLRFTVSFDMDGIKDLFRK